MMLSTACRPRFKISDKEMFFSHLSWWQAKWSRGKYGTLFNFHVRLKNYYSQPSRLLTKRQNTSKGFPKSIDALVNSLRFPALSITLLNFVPLKGSEPVGACSAGNESRLCGRVVREKLEISSIGQFRRL